MTLLDAVTGENEETIKAICWVRLSEIRRAVAIAQVVEEQMQNGNHRVRVAAETILERADELNVS